MSLWHVTWLKATLKAPALREFIERVVDALITRQSGRVAQIYNEYVSEIQCISDISRWSTKKTITLSVINPRRPNERKVLDALEGTEYAQGDKRYFYFRKDKSRALSEQWSAGDPDHSVDKLLEDLYKTLRPHCNLLAMDQMHYSWPPREHKTSRSSLVRTMNLYGNQ